MSFSKYNMERTRAPRQRIPWWVYAGSVVLAGLLIWGVVKALPGKKERAGEPVKEEASMETLASAPSASAPAPVRPETPPAASPPATPASAPPLAPPDRPAATLPAAPQLQQARTARDAGDYTKAREMALSVWNATGDTRVKADAESILNEVGIGLVLSPRAMPEKEDYTVQPGDSLEKIAKKFGTTVELIRAGNNIRGHLIRVGDRLRIFNGTFSVSVSKSANDLVLSMNDTFFKRYPVGTGEYNKTPVGDFLINDRIPQPTWWRPDGKSIPYGDPENLLGTHWLSINIKGYGLHGTWEPETIGKQASAGCVRMLNEDIEQLFTLLPLGTPVSIRD